MSRVWNAQTARRRWLAAILVCVLGRAMVQAQLPTATILGVVKDSTGAVVPGARLAVRNEETGQTRTGVTASDGSYRFSALPVGSYEVRVEQTGFQSEIRKGLTLTVGQEAVVNFALEVGAIEQTVSVTADAPLVNTTSGSLGGLVDEQSVADLPLNGRNYIQLSLLQPGIQEHRSFSGTAGLTGTLFSSNGAPLRSNNYLLDGAIMQNFAGGSSASTSGTTLGVEGIREYRVITNSFSAEYGMAMGSQMMIVTKSGTNTFHGSLFEYLRNSALDARNFFDYKTNVNKRRLPAFARNNFGGSFGGPIRKDKTFIFGVFEALRERLGVTTLSNTIPLSARVDGGTVPAIAPVIKPLLTLYPEPNLGTAQFTFPFSQPTTENYGQIRVDQTFSANDTFFARYTIDDDEVVQPLEFPQFTQQKESRAQYGTLSENHIFSPSLLNTFRFSWSRTIATRDSPSGIIGPQLSFIPELEVGVLQVGGVSRLGPQGSTPNAQNQNIFTWSDDVFYSRPRHSVKFGFLINRYRQYFQNPTDLRGQITFANLQSFLLGQAASYVAITPGSITNRTYQYNTLGFYVQDDLRVRSNFTLNLGFRYEFQTEFDEIRGHGSAMRDPLHDANPTLGSPFQNPSLKNLSPRVGFAWDVRGNGRTALRGGFGLLYDIGNLGSALLQTAFASPPFSSQSTVLAPPSLSLPLFFPLAAVGKSIQAIDYHLKQPHLLQYNLTVQRELPFAMALSVSYAGSRGINLVHQIDANPTVPQLLPDGREFWTGNERRINPNWDSITMRTSGGNSWYNALQVGLTKRLSKGVQFQSSYTWSKLIDENTVQTGIDQSSNSATGVNTFNRALDRAVAAYDMPHNWRFNLIYRFPAFASEGALAKLVNGWWLSSILALQKGYAFTPVLQTNRSRSQVTGAVAGLDRPDLVLGRKNETITQGTTAGCLGVNVGQKLGGPKLYYDPCAFTIQAAGFLGTAGRNILRGPGYANLDFSLGKDTALRFLGEAGKLEFRAEFFNLLNRAQFALPNRTVFAARLNVEPALATAGQITSTNAASRQVQLALKILF